MFLLGILLFVACGPAYLLAGIWAARRLEPAPDSLAPVPGMAEARLESTRQITSTLQVVEQISTDVRRSIAEGGGPSAEDLLRSLVTVQEQLFEASASIQRIIDPDTEATDVFRQGYTELDEPEIALARSLIDAQSEERRSTVRVPYVACQYVARHESHRRLQTSDFDLVHCRNLCAKGIAFVSRRALPRNLVLTLGSATARLFMDVQVMYQFPLKPTEGFGYLVGCQFMRRSTNQPEAWIEPETAPQAADALLV